MKYKAQRASIREKLAHLEALLDTKPLPGHALLNATDDLEWAVERLAKVVHRAAVKVIREAKANG